MNRLRLEKMTSWMRLDARLPCQAHSDGVNKLQLPNSSLGQNAITPTRDPH